MRRLFQLSVAIIMLCNTHLENFRDTYTCKLYVYPAHEPERFSWPNWVGSLVWSPLWVIEHPAHAGWASSCIWRSTGCCSSRKSHLKRYNDSLSRRLVWESSPGNLRGAEKPVMQTLWEPLLVLHLLKSTGQTKLRD